MMCNSFLYYWILFSNILLQIFSYIFINDTHFWTSLMAQMVKNLPAIQETQVRFLGQEDSLEKGMATHSSVLAWEIP